MRVVITPQAEEDLDGHFEYVLDRDPGAALRMYDAIIGQIASLSEMPYRTRQGRVPGTREKVIIGYPYIVVFEVSAEEVIILHVNHAHQLWPREEP